jgi:hypothetical protein
VIIVDAAGRVLIDSDAAAATSTPCSSRPEIARALRDAIAQGTRHSDSLRADLLYTAVPIVDGGHVTDAVRVTPRASRADDE